MRSFRDSDGVVRWSVPGEANVSAPRGQQRRDTSDERSPLLDLPRKSVDSRGRPAHRESPYSFPSDSDENVETSNLGFRTGLFIICSLLLLTLGVATYGKVHQEYLMTTNKPVYTEPNPMNNVCELTNNEDKCSHLKTQVVVDAVDGKWPHGFSWVVLKEESRSSGDKSFMFSEYGNFEQPADMVCQKYMTELCLDGSYIVYTNSESVTEDRSVSLEVCDSTIGVGEALDFVVSGDSCQVTRVERSNYETPIEPAEHVFKLNDAGNGPLRKQATAGIAPLSLSLSLSLDISLPTAAPTTLTSEDVDETSYPTNAPTLTPRCYFFGLICDSDFSKTPKPTATPTHVPTVFGESVEPTPSPTQFDFLNAVQFWKLWEESKAPTISPTPIPGSDTVVADEPSKAPALIPDFDVNKIITVQNGTDISNVLNFGGKKNGTNDFF